MQILIEFIFQALVEGLLFGTGKLVLPLLSRGKWQAIDIADIKVGYNTKTKLDFLKRGTDGILYFSFRATVLAGIFIWIVILVFTLSIFG